MINIIFTVGFQLAGAIILAYGLAFRRKKEVIEQSIGYNAIFMGEVPKIIKDKWAETYLCRYGLLYTGIGYFISLFEVQLTFNIGIKLIGVFLLVIMLVIPALVISEHQAEIKFNKVSPDEVLEQAKGNSIVIDRMD